MPAIITVCLRILNHQRWGKKAIVIHRFHQSQGVTLIEVLITSVLVGIFAAIATPSFMGWLDSRRIEDVTAQVESALKEAQAEAQKRGISCAVEISPTTITATPSSCLPTGIKDLTKLGVAALTKNQSGTTLASNLVAPVRVRVSHKGNISFPSSTSEVVITVFHQSGANLQGRCIAITSGIGIMRRGKYVGQNPASPVPNGCETVES